MTLSRRHVLAGGLVAAASLALPSPARAASNWELHEKFGGMADGPTPAYAATGQRMTDYTASGQPAGFPWVRNGFMSARYPQQFEIGTYRIAQLSGAVREVGARFALTPEIVGGGLLCLSIQMGNIAYDPPVPVSPMHFYVNKWGWNMDVNGEAGTGVEYVASGGFTSPLVDDGQTIYGMGVLLDRANNRCTLWLPDGQVVTLAHSGFNRGGRYVYVEPFKTPGDSNLKSAALVREWWASS